MGMQMQGRVGAAFAAAGLIVGACGGSGDPADLPADAPTVVVSSNILGDVVGVLAGDDLEVVTLMPVGVDPHDFQASAQQVAQLNAADALIVNGGGFEEGLLDVIEAAEGDGVPTFEALSAVSPLEGDEHDDHDHDGVDPHFFTDPARMALAVEAISDFLAQTLEGIDVDALEVRTEAYVAELEALDADLTERFAALDDDQRVLVTNHEVFGYFADRYDFEVIGAVIPAGSTSDGADAAALTDLAEIVEQEGVPAVFSDESASDELVQTLAAEVGAVEIVALYSETLGPEGEPAGTYLGMIAVNAERIIDALG